MIIIKKLKKENEGIGSNLKNLFSRYFCKLQRI